MAKEKFFHVGVKALITNSEGRILILEANTSQFLIHERSHADLPGGRIDRGEEPLDALRREIAEETGITSYKNTEFLTAVVSPMQIPISQTEKVGLVLFVYKVTVPSDVTPILSDEHTSYEWAKPREAVKRLEFKFGKDFAKALLHNSD